MRGGPRGRQVHAGGGDHEGAKGRRVIVGARVEDGGGRELESPCLKWKCNFWPLAKANMMKQHFSMKGGEP